MARHTSSGRQPKNVPPSSIEDRDDGSKRHAESTELPGDSYLGISQNVNHANRKSQNPTGEHARPMLKKDSLLNSGALLKESDERLKRGGAHLNSDSTKRSKENRAEKSSSEMLGLSGNAMTSVKIADSERTAENKFRKSSDSVLESRKGHQHSESSRTVADSAAEFSEEGVTPADYRRISKTMEDKAPSVAGYVDHKVGQNHQFSRTQPTSADKSPTPNSHVEASDKIPSHTRLDAEASRVDLSKSSSQMKATKSSVPANRDRADSEPEISKADRAKSQGKEAVESAQAESRDGKGHRNEVTSLEPRDNAPQPTKNTILKIRVKPPMPVTVSETLGEVRSEGVPTEESKASRGRDSASRTAASSEEHSVRVEDKAVTHEEVKKKNPRFQGNQHMSEGAPHPHHETGFSVHVKVSENKTEEGEKSQVGLPEGIHSHGVHRLKNTKEVSKEGSTSYEKSVVGPSLLRVHSGSSVEEHRDGHALHNAGENAPKIQHTDKVVQKQTSRFHAHQKVTMKKFENSVGSSLINLKSYLQDQVAVFWSQWGPWSECSATCGSDAARVRSRLCSDAKQKACPGKRRQRKKCGYTGCEGSLSCFTAPCLNDGWCQDVRNTTLNPYVKFTCVCPIGVSGKLCEYDYRPNLLTGLAFLWGFLILALIIAICLCRKRSDDKSAGQKFPKKPHPKDGDGMETLQLILEPRAGFTQPSLQKPRSVDTIESGPPRDVYKDLDDDFCRRSRQVRSQIEGSTESFSSFDSTGSSGDSFNQYGYKFYEGVNPPQKVHYPQLLAEIPGAPSNTVFSSLENFQKQDVGRSLTELPQSWDLGGVRMDEKFPGVVAKHCRGVADGAPASAFDSKSKDLLAAAKAALSAVEQNAEEEGLECDQKSWSSSDSMIHNMDMKVIETDEKSWSSSECLRLDSDLANFLSVVDTGGASGDLVGAATSSMSSVCVSKDSLTPIIHPEKSSTKSLLVSTEKLSPVCSSVCSDSQHDKSEPETKSLAKIPSAISQMSEVDSEPKFMGFKSPSEGQKFRFQGSASHVLARTWSMPLSTKGYVKSDDSLIALREGDKSLHSVASQDARMDMSATSSKQSNKLHTSCSSRVESGTDVKRQQVLTSGMSGEKTESASTESLKSDKHSSKKSSIMNVTTERMVMGTESSSSNADLPSSLESVTLTKVVAVKHITNKTCESCELRFGVGSSSYVTDYEESTDSEEGQVQYPSEEKIQGSSSSTMTLVPSEPFPKPSGSSSTSTSDIASMIRQSKASVESDWSVKDKVDNLIEWEDETPLVLSVVNIITESDIRSDDSSLKESEFEKISDSQSSSLVSEKEQDVAQRPTHVPSTTTTSCSDDSYATILKLPSLPQVDARMEFWGRHPESVYIMDKKVSKMAAQATESRHSSTSSDDARSSAHVRELRSDTTSSSAESRKTLDTTSTTSHNRTFSSSFWNQRVDRKSSTDEAVPRDILSYENSSVSPKTSLDVTPLAPQRRYSGPKHMRATSSDALFWGQELNTGQSIQVSRTAGNDQGETQENSSTDYSLGEIEAHVESSEQSNESFGPGESTSRSYRTSSVSSSTSHIPLAAHVETESSSTRRCTRTETSASLTSDSAESSKTPDTTSTTSYDKTSTSSFWNQRINLKSSTEEALPRDISSFENSDVSTEMSLDVTPLTLQKRSSGSKHMSATSTDVLFWDQELNTGQSTLVSRTAGKDQGATQENSSTDYSLGEIEAHVESSEQSKESFGPGECTSRSYRTSSVSSCTSRIPLAAHVETESSSTRRCTLTETSTGMTSDSAESSKTPDTTSTTSHDKTSSSSFWNQRINLKSSTEEALPRDISSSENSDVSTETSLDVTPMAPQRRYSGSKRMSATSLDVLFWDQDINAGQSILVSRTAGKDQGATQENSSTDYSLGEIEADVASSEQSEESSEPGESTPRSYTTSTASASTSRVTLTAREKTSSSSTRRCTQTETRTSMTSHSARVSARSSLTQPSDDEWAEFFQRYSDEESSPSSPTPQTRSTFSSGTMKRCASSSTSRDDSERSMLPRRHSSESVRLHDTQFRRKSSTKLKLTSSDNTMLNQGVQQSTSGSTDVPRRKSSITLDSVVSGDSSIIEIDEAEVSELYTSWAEEEEGGDEDVARQVQYGIFEEAKPSSCSQRLNFEMDMSKTEQSLSDEEDVHFGSSENSRRWSSSQKLTQYEEGSPRETSPFEDTDDDSSVQYSISEEENYSYFSQSLRNEIDLGKQEHSPSNSTPTTEDFSLSGTDGSSRSDLATFESNQELFQTDPEIQQNDQILKSFESPEDLTPVTAPRKKKFGPGIPSPMQFYFTTRIEASKLASPEIMRKGPSPSDASTTSMQHSYKSIHELSSAATVETDNESSTSSAVAPRVDVVNAWIPKLVSPGMNPLAPNHPSPFDTPSDLIRRVQALSITSTDRSTEPEGWSGDSSGLSNLLFRKRSDNSDLISGSPRHSTPKKDQSLPDGFGEMITSELQNSSQPFPQENEYVRAMNTLHPALQTPVPEVEYGYVGMVKNAPMPADISNESDKTSAKIMDYHQIPTAWTKETDMTKQEIPSQFDTGPWRAFARNVLDTVPETHDSEEGLSDILEVHSQNFPSPLPQRMEVSAEGSRGWHYHASEEGTPIHCALCKDKDHGTRRTSYQLDGYTHKAKRSPTIKRASKQWENADNQAEAHANAESLRPVKSGHKAMNISDRGSVSEYSEVPRIRRASMKPGVRIKLKSSKLSNLDTAKTKTGRRHSSVRKRRRESNLLSTLATELVSRREKIFPAFLAGRRNTRFDAESLSGSIDWSSDDTTPRGKPLSQTRKRSMAVGRGVIGQDDLEESPLYQSAEAAFRPEMPGKSAETVSPIVKMVRRFTMFITRSGRKDSSAKPEDSQTSHRRQSEIPTQPRRQSGAAASSSPRKLSVGQSGQTRRRSLFPGMAPRVKVDAELAPIGEYRHKKSWVGEEKTQTRQDLSREERIPGVRKHSMAHNAGTEHTQSGQDYFRDGRVPGVRKHSMAQPSEERSRKASTFGQHFVKRPEDATTPEIPYERRGTIRQVLQLDKAEGSSMIETPKIEQANEYLQRVAPDNLHFSEHMRRHTLTPQSADFQIKDVHGHSSANTTPAAAYVPQTGMDDTIQGTYREIIVGPEGTSQVPRLESVLPRQPVQERKERQTAQVCAIQYPDNAVHGVQGANVRQIRSFQESRRDHAALDPNIGVPDANSRRYTIGHFDIPSGETVQPLLEVHVQSSRRHSIRPLGQPLDKEERSADTPSLFRIDHAVTRQTTLSKPENVLSAEPGISGMVRLTPDGIVMKKMKKIPKRLNIQYYDVVSEDRGGYSTNTSWDGRPKFSPPGVHMSASQISDEAARHRQLYSQEEVPQKVSPKSAKFGTGAQDDDVTTRSYPRKHPMQHGGADQYIVTKRDKGRRANLLRIEETQGPLSSTLGSSIETSSVDSQTDQFSLTDMPWIKRAPLKPSARKKLSIARARKESLFVNYLKPQPEVDSGLVTRSEGIGQSDVGTGVAPQYSSTLTTGQVPSQGWHTEAQVWDAPAGQLSQQRGSAHPLSVWNQLSKQAQEVQTSSQQCGVMDSHLSQQRLPGQQTSQQEWIHRSAQQDSVMMNQLSLQPGDQQGSYQLSQEDSYWPNQYVTPGHYGNVGYTSSIRALELDELSIPVNQDFKGNYGAEPLYTSPRNYSDTSDSTASYTPTMSPREQANS